MREKRSYIRLNMPMEIVYSFHENKENKLYAIGQDISLGGVRILIDRKLEAGMILELQVNVASLNKPIIVVGEVVWQQVKSRNNSNYYETGLKFTKINIQNRKNIKEALISSVREILKKLDRIIIEESKD